MANTSLMSLGYSGAAHGRPMLPTPAPPASPAPPAQGPELKWSRTGNRFIENIERLAIIAVCEVVEHPTLNRHSWGYVAPLESTVCTRLLLVLPDGMTQNVSMDSKLTDEIRTLMTKLHVGQVAD